MRSLFLVLAACTAAPEPDAGPAYPAEVTDHLDLSASPLLDVPAAFEDDYIDSFDQVRRRDLVADWVILGRVLFYDPALSSDGTVSCATCHLQEHAFTDPQAASVGVTGNPTPRNAMSMVNLRWAPTGRYFWDERAEGLDTQVRLPLQDADEMGMTPEEVVAAVEGQPYYAELFTRAWGDPDVSFKRIAEALAEFGFALVSADSPYDRALAEGGNALQPLPGFTAEQELGRAIFFGQHKTDRGGCASCHLTNGPPIRDGQEAILNEVLFQFGLPLGNGVPTDDPGAGASRFRAPSLRNVAVTGPYMHDGRFETLRDVVDHYADGIVLQPGLDPLLREPGFGDALRIDLDEAEREALVAFLHTLTDDAFLTEPAWADPFLP